MKLWRSQAGDTLLEVVFALILLSSVLVGGFALVRVSRVNNQNSLQRTQAINMVREQYEALREFRDANLLPPTSWSGFEQGVRNSLSVAPGCVITAPDAHCYFHMERSSLNVVGGWTGAYGHWVPCGLSWFPPLDSDNVWTGTPYCNEGPRQSNIEVKIQLLSPLVCPAGNPYLSFQITATWKQGGLNSTDSTTLSTILANLKNEATGC